MRSPRPLACSDSIMDDGTNHRSPLRAAKPPTWQTPYVIAFLRRKITYKKFWRPRTAFREAPPPMANPRHFLAELASELANTTPDPSLPERHMRLSASGESVLMSFFRENPFQFTRYFRIPAGSGSLHFTSCSSAAVEKSHLKRICAGAVPFRSDLTPVNISADKERI